MNPNQANKDLKVLLATVRQQRLAILGLVVCLGLALVIMFNMVGRERIVLTPPTIEKSFWVAKDKVSASYLEQMGGFMAYLTLDVSPSSIEWKKAMLLQYVAPDVYGALQTRQDLEADRLKRLNATTQFSVAQLVPDEDTLVGPPQGPARDLHQRDPHLRRREGVRRRLRLHRKPDPTQAFRGVQRWHPQDCCRQRGCWRR